MSSQLGPGLLLVFAETGANCTEQEFHDWYDNEHIPLRTSTLETFVSAARYEAVSVDESKPNPKWSAVYTISDNIIFQQDRYTKLRANRSPREADVVKRLERLDRRIYKQVSGHGSNPTPQSPNASFVLFDSFEAKTDLNNLAEFEALLVSAEKRFEAVPGFVRIRRELAEDVVVSGMGAKPDDKDAVPSILLFSEFDAQPDQVLKSTEYLSLKEWLDDAVVPFSVASKRETRAFKLWKEYEPTAALNLASAGVA